MNNKRHSLAWQQLKEDVDRAYNTLNDRRLDLRTYRHKFSYRDKPTRICVRDAQVTVDEIGKRLSEIIDLLDKYDWRDVDEQET